MAGWGFTADSEYQNELAGKLESAADKYDNKVTALYNEVDNMGSNWSGEDYDMFNSSTKAYKPALDDLSDGFRMFAEHYKKMATGTETLATECIDIIMNMTGDSSGVYANINGGTTGDGSNTTPGGDTNNADTVPDGAAVGVGDPAATTEEQTYVDHGFTEWFGANSYWQNIGSDYKDNFHFENANSAWDYVWEGVGGSVETVVDAAQTVGNVAFDGVNEVLEGAQWLLNGHWGGYESDTEVTNNPSGFTNPYDNAYWNNLGSDFTENWDYSNADSAWDYVWETGSGVVETVWDGVMVPVNGIVDTAQGAVECVEWAWNGLLDLVF